MRENGEEYLDLDIQYPVKTHEEILTLIEEIKAFEHWIETGPLPEPTLPKTEELIEFTPVAEEFPEWECINLEGEPQGHPAPLDAKGDTSNLLKRQRSPSSVKSSIFHLRFDDEGNLINIDLRTPKESTKIDNVKNTLLQKLHRKQQTQTEGEETEETPSKISKVKAGLGKVGKLKKLILKRNKEPEVLEEDPDEEDEADEDW